METRGAPAKLKSSGPSKSVVREVVLWKDRKKEGMILLLRLRMVSER